jgi:uncharacterized Zn finger protein
VAALHYVLAEAFDREPFLLFELRGRSKEAVLAALRALRASGPVPAAAREADEGAAGVSLDDVAPDRYDDFRAPADDLHFAIAEPGVENAVLRQLQSPPGWTGDKSLLELVGPSVAAAAALARELAVASAPVAETPAEEPADSPR